MTEFVDVPQSAASTDPPAPQVLRTRLFELAILFWSLPFGLVILTYFQLWRRPTEVRLALRLWSRGFIACARGILGVRYRIEGLHNIPDCAVIFVANHQSYWESIAFTAFFPDINVVTKAEAMKIPVFGWGLRHAPMIPVVRSQPGRNLRRIVRDAQRSLAEGRGVLLFPEGTRVAPGARRPHLRGIEAMYRDCAVPIVPVVHNAGLLWTRGFQPKRSGDVILRFLPSIDPGSPAHAVAERIEAVLNYEKDQLSILTVNGQYSQGVAT